MRAQPAYAAVDLNGLWRVGVFVTDLSLTFTDVCSLTIVQSGTTLSIDGPCEGMANPVSAQRQHRSRRPAASPPAGRPAPARRSPSSGTVALDSASFTGAFELSGASASSGGVNASRCGNGQIDAGETVRRRQPARRRLLHLELPARSRRRAVRRRRQPVHQRHLRRGGSCQHTNRTGACDDGNACTVGDTCSGGQCVGTVPAGRHAVQRRQRLHRPATAAWAASARRIRSSAPPVMACDVSRGCVPTISTGCKEAAASSIVLRRLRVRCGRLEVAARRRDARGRASATRPPRPTTTSASTTATSTPNGVAAPGGQRARAGRQRLVPDRGAGSRTRVEISRPTACKRIRLQERGGGQVAHRGAGSRAAISRCRRSQSIALPAHRAAQIAATGRTRNAGRRSTTSRRATSAAVQGARRAYPADRHASEHPDHQPRRHPRRRHRPHADAGAAGGRRRLVHQLLRRQSALRAEPRLAADRPALARATASGRSAGSSAARRSSAQLGSDRQTIATWLQAAGYMTGLFGKYINGYGFAARGHAGTGWGPSTCRRAGRAGAR